MTARLQQAEISDLTHSRLIAGPGDWKLASLTGDSGGLSCKPLGAGFADPFSLCGFCRAILRATLYFSEMLVRFSGNSREKLRICRMKIERGRRIPWGMKPEERQRMYELCDLIEKETDHVKAIQLIKELNRLLRPKAQPPRSPEEI